MTLLPRATGARPTARRAALAPPDASDIVAADGEGRREKRRSSLLRSMHVEELEKHVAMTAGIALGRVPKSTTVDAIVAFLVK